MNNIGLYRAKREDTKEWVEGYLVENYILTGIDWDDNGNWIIYPIKITPETVCRLTPIRDKHKNLAWEGDIIEHRYIDNNGKEVVVRQVIEFTYLEAGDDADLDSYGYHINPYWKGDFEIVGNKFDNPELLEGK